MIQRLEKGSNFAGYRANYAPETHWSDISTQLEAVLENAKEESDGINAILTKIENTNVLNSFNVIQQSEIDLFKNKVQETDKLIDIQRRLKSETLKVSFSGIKLNYFQ